MEKLGQLYQQGFDTKAYLDNYFAGGGLLDVDQFFSTHVFRAFQQGKMRGPRCIDVGAGPLIHRLSIASKFCDVMVHTDYTDSNRDAARLWLTTDQLDQQHRHLTKKTARLEGFKDEEAGAKEIESRLRSKWSLILPIDILKSDPIGDLSNIGGPFDCAISSACIESACQNYEQYVQAAKNIGNLLKTGSGLALSGFLNGTFYRTGGTKFPCLKWDAEMVKRGLEEAGFTVQLVDVLEYPPDVYEEENPASDCSSSFFCLAHKN